MHISYSSDKLSKDLLRLFIGNRPIAEEIII